MEIGNFGNVFNGKKVIVTGNTGFKGSWLTVWLLELGAKVYGISKDVPTNPSMFEALKLRDRIQHYQTDIRDLESIKRIFEEISPDFVFHLAAQPIVSASYTNPIETIATNVLGTAHILEALRGLKNKCNAVIITSDKCYDNVEWTWGYRENDRLGGKDPYSASKGAAELIINTYHQSYFSKVDSNVQTVSVRAGNVIGGGDWAANRIVPDCIRAWNNSVPVELRNPTATRPWQHVLEPLSGYLRVAQLMTTERKICGEAYNFGPLADQSHTVYELLSRISTLWKFNTSFDRFIFDSNHKFHEAGLLKLNCDKALHQLHWKPVLNFDLTVNYTALWYLEFYSDISEMYSLTVDQISNYTNEAKTKEIAWAN